MLKTRERSAVPAEFLSGGGETGELMRSLDWSRTALGPLDGWPQSLRTSISTCLNCAFPILIWWGPKLVMLYNDEYSVILGPHKHPRAMGRPGIEAWSEIWGVIGPMLQKVREQRLPARARDLMLEMDRSGYTEETYFSFSYSPIIDEAGDVGGVFSPVMETTEQVINERRLAILRDLAALPRLESSPRMCMDFVAALSKAERDIPFTLCYYVDAGRDVAERCAIAGISDDHKAAPVTIALDDMDAPWPLSRATGGPCLVDDLGRRFGTLPGGPWREASREALILPIRLPGAPQPLAYLITAVSPRRALDAAYRTFYQLVGDALAAALADIEALAQERRRAEALAEIDHAKTEFFSNVSHEFRTPLTLLLGPLEECVTEPSLPEAVRNHLDLAHRNTLRLLKMVNSLLDFSRIEAAQLNASLQPVDLPALTRDIASSFRAAIEKAELEFVVHCEQFSGAVVIDPDMWERILLNLLSNALKFTLRGRIEVALGRSGGDIVLAVADTGIGIPEAEQPHLFKRFHRVPAGAARTHEGTGIGLALVLELARLHGGTVTVESELGTGSRFEVRLPLQPAPPAATPVPARPGQSTTAFVQEALRWLPEENPGDDSGVDQPQPAGSQGELFQRRFSNNFGARILVADDNADMRAYLRNLLSPFYSVESVNDGDQALAAIRRQPPDLLISDVMMPGTDGFALVRQLRDDSALQQLPILLLSARAGGKARAEGIDLGADDYMLKPFSARELHARVGALLERERLHRQALAQRDEFLAMLAHELRNPLAPIRNAGEILSRTLPADSIASTAANVIKRQISQLTRLVDDLLDVSRITRGRIELKSETVVLQQVITQAAETMEPLLREHAQRFSLSLPGEPILVKGDFVRLVQCVVNTLSNANKYTDDGGEVQLTLSAQDGTALISVRDSGVGIAPELLPRIFDLFVQGNRTLDRSQGGLGIGLSVVKALVERHGGSVAARSAGGGLGTVFELRLPRQRRGEPPAPSERPRVPLRRVLVVDDNIDSANSLAALLTLDGHETRIAYNASQALTLLQDFEPHLAILDIGLPGMDGYELVRKLRAMPQLAHTRMVALTGYGQPEDRELARAAGFDAHLVKPLDFDALLRLLR